MRLKPTKNRPISKERRKPPLRKSGRLAKKSCGARPQHQSLFERTGLPPPPLQRSQLHIHVRQNRGNGDLFRISWNGKIVGADLRSCNGRQRNDAYRVREHLTEAEMDKLLSALEGNRHGHRDWLIGLMAQGQH